MKANYKISYDDLDKIVNGIRPKKMGNQSFEDLYDFAITLKQDNISDEEIKQIMVNEYDICESIDSKVLDYVITFIYFFIMLFAFWLLSYFSAGNHFLFYSLFFLSLGFFLIIKKPYFSISIIRKEKLNNKDRKILINNIGYISIFIGILSFSVTIFKFSFLPSAIFFIGGITVIYIYTVIFTVFSKH